MPSLPASSRGRHLALLAVLATLLALIPTRAAAAPVDSRETAAIEAAQAAVAEPVAMPPLTYVVPVNHPDVKPVAGGQFNNLRFPEYSRFFEKDARRETLSVKRVGDEAVEVEMRFETRVRTGISARRYRLASSLEQADTSYRLRLQPISQIAFQTKWLGMALVPIPAFDERELREVLLSPVLSVAVEINSEFNPDSLYANFLRLAQRVRPEVSRSEGAGTALRGEMAVSLRNKRVLFQLQVFPYRNGSKAVITTELPALLTSQDTVDFLVLLDEFREALSAIARS